MINLHFYFSLQPDDRNEHVITKTWESGVYMFIISISPNNTDSIDYKATGKCPDLSGRCNLYMNDSAPYVQILDGHQQTAKTIAESTEQCF